MTDVRFTKTIPTEEKKTSGHTNSTVSAFSFDFFNSRNDLYKMPANPLSQEATNRSPQITPPIINNAAIKEFLISISPATPPSDEDYSPMNITNNPSEEKLTPLQIHRFSTLINNATFPKVAVTPKNIMLDTDNTLKNAREHLVILQEHQKYIDAYPLGGQIYSITQECSYNCNQKRIKHNYVALANEVANKLNPLALTIIEVNSQKQNQQIKIQESFITTLLEHGNFLDPRNKAYFGNMMRRL